VNRGKRGVAEASSVTIRNLGGRPEKYRPEFCDQLVEFFLDAAKVPAQVAQPLKSMAPVTRLRARSGRAR
jgi:hypothetical protein